MIVLDPRNIFRPGFRHEIPSFKPLLVNLIPLKVGMCFSAKSHSRGIGTERKKLKKTQILEYLKLIVQQNEQDNELLTLVKEGM